MKLSIVILTFDAMALTRRCLDPLQEVLRRDGDVEIIVVDNGSTDGSREEFLRHDYIRYFYQKTNRGVAAGRNIGIRKARGRYIMLLDNDTIPSVDAVRDLVAYMDSHPEIGLCAPRLTSPEGLTQRSFRPYPGITEKLKSLTGGNSDIVPAGEIPDCAIEPYYVIGACQIFRSDLTKRPDMLLDEKIFYGPEDADFCQRIRMHGYKVFYNPEITIIHDWMRAGRSVFSKLGRRHIMGLIYFWGKWKRLR